MADFDYILPNNSKLYKGGPSEFTWMYVSGNRHVWFAEKLETAKKYGQFVHTFETVKELKLINISSPLFHYDFIGKLNLLYRNNDGKDSRKSWALMPIGLPSLKEARRTLSALNIDSYLDINTEKEDVIIWGSYFNHAYRMSLSLNNEKLDDNFVNALKDIYGSKYNGYIQPIPTPTILYGGGFAHEELCLFNSSDVKLKTKGGSKKTKQRGGTTVENPNLIVPHLQHINFDISTWTPEMERKISQTLFPTKTQTNIIKYAR